MGMGIRQAGDNTETFDCGWCEDRQATFIAHSCGCDFGQEFLCTHCAADSFNSLNCLGVSLFFC